MANTIRIKRRSQGGAAGAPSSLANAELAFNEADNILYYGNGTGGAGGSATTVDAIGGKGAVLMLTGAQTVAGVKTFSSSPILPTPLTADNSTTAATTAYVKAQGYITGNQTITYTGDATGSGTSNDIIGITGVQLEIGSIATPFEHRPYSAEEYLCKRYYEWGYTWVYLWADNTNGLHSSYVRYTVPKRVSPTLSLSAGTADATSYLGFNHYFGSVAGQNYSNGAWYATAEL